VELHICLNKIDLLQQPLYPGICHIFFHLNSGPAILAGYFLGIQERQATPFCAAFLFPWISQFINRVQNPFFFFDGAPMVSSPNFYSASYHGRTW
jgi:hypothetical protein